MTVTALRGESANPAFRRALLAGTALALVFGGATARAEDGPRATESNQRERNLERRVEDLERELRLLRNQQRRARATQDTERVVRSGNDRVQVSVYGQVNRAFVGAFGQNGQTDLLSVDNDNSSTRLGVDGDARINEDITVNASIEFELQSNASDNVSTGTDGMFDNPSGVNLRKAELRFRHARLGSLWLGQGDSATDDIAEQDLSGTTVVAKSEIKSTFGGIEHEDRLTGTAFANVARGDELFDNLDGNSRQNRVRYDTPTVMGFQGRVSLDEDNAPAASIFHASEPSFGAQQFEVAAAFGWTHRPTGQAIGGGMAPRAAGNSNLYSGSVSVLHKNSGISLTFAGGTEVLRTGGPGSAPNPWFVFVKLGYRRHWFEMGETRLSIDWTRNDHEHSAGSHAQSVRVAIVQRIEAAAMDLYFAYGYQDAYIRGADLAPFHGVFAGARVKF